jgi:hypothetical protein
METWAPERLPTRFRPLRGRGADRSAPRRVWCSLAVAVAVLVLAVVAYAQSQAAARVPMVVQLLLGTSIRLTPAPTPAQQVRPPPSRVTTPRATSEPRQPVVASTPETIESSPIPTDPPASPPAPPPPPVAATTTTSAARQKPRTDSCPLLVCLDSAVQQPADPPRPGRDRRDQSGEGHPHRDDGQHRGDA